MNSVSRFRLIAVVKSSKRASDGYKKNGTRGVKAAGQEYGPPT